MSVWNWLKNKMNKSDKSDKKKVTTELVQEDYELVKLLASKSEVSVSEWVRVAVQKAIPADLRARTVDAGAITALHEAAEAAANEEATPFTIPLPPEAIALTEAAMNQQAYERHHDEQKRVSAEAEKEAEGLTTAPHACVFLRKQPPAYSSFTLANCEGTCANPSQAGRPCFWSSSVASQCPKFAPRVQFRRPQ